jgi:hypothetical protein
MKYNIWKSFLTQKNLNILSGYPFDNQRELMASKEANMAAHQVQWFIFTLKVIKKKLIQYAYARYEVIKASD